MALPPGVLVDDEDLPLVEQHNWYVAEHGYVVSTSGNIYLHRLVLGCTKGDGTYVDHRNHNPLDNRKANLKVGTQADNMANCRSHRDAKSRYKGVHPTPYGRWAAQFSRQGRRVHVGTFATELDAHEALELARRAA